MPASGALLRLGRAGRDRAIHRAPLPRRPRLGPRAHLGGRFARVAIAAVLAATTALAAGVHAPGPAAAVSTGRVTAIAAGYDVSWPNCGRRLPSGALVGVVGVTGGHPFSTNQCLAAQYAWARRTGAPRLYMNITAPNGSTAGMGRTGPAGTCSTSRPLCRAYNYGYNAARAAWAYAASRLGWRAVRTSWWLDVELSFRWTRSTAVNARSVAGAIAYLRGRGVAVGVYSTGYQWRHLTGSYRPGVAVWYATAVRSRVSASRYCSSRYAFTGGRVRMVQYQPGGLDADYACR